MATVNLKCDGIACDHQVTVEIPDWLTRNDDVDFGGESSWLFHPDCKPQMQWFDAVCPGCVSSFGECGLSAAFGYSHSKGLTDEQKTIIRAGVCPFRVNGTFGFSPRSSKIEDLDLSERAPAGTGDAIVAAIELYKVKYSS